MCVIVFVISYRTLLLSNKDFFIVGALIGSLKRRAAHLTVLLTAPFDDGYQRWETLLPELYIFLKII